MQVNILFLDVETTGLDPEKHRLLQIAARLDIDVNGGDKKGEPEYFETRVGHYMFLDGKPTFEVSLGALNIIRKNILDVNMKNPDDLGETGAMITFCNWLLEKKQKYGELVLSGHNVQFDVGFINKALERAGINGFNDIVGYRRLDTASISGFLKMIGVMQNEKNSLEDTARALSIATEGNHEARFDVDLTAKVLYGMADKVKRYYTARAAGGLGITKIPENSYLAKA